MAHNLYKDTMMYVKAEGEPWHKLGVGLDNPATSDEAIKASGLDYEVALKPLYAKVEGVSNDPSNFRPFQDKWASVNMETKKCLGVVGSKYRILQNRDAFKFFDGIVGEGKAIYHTAGALGDGERIWLLAKLKGKDIIVKDEHIEKYLCLTNSHDGKTSVSVFFTPIRVVCQNTLSLAMKDRAENVNLRHSGNMELKVQEAQRILGISLKKFDDIEQLGNALASRQVNVATAERYFSNVLGITSEEKEGQSRLLNQRGYLLDLFDNGKGARNPSVRHTLWTAYNAVTEYVDHFRTVRGGEHDRSKRLETIWFGYGADLKAKALTLAQTALMN